MARPAARFVVAFVADVYGAIPNRAMRQLPGNSMRVFHLSSEPDLSVPRRVPNALPLPTATTSADPGPELLRRLYFVPLAGLTYWALATCQVFVNCHRCYAQLLCNLPH